MNQNTFKALQLQQYGQPPVLVDVEFPDLQEGQVLIKIQAAPINPADYSFLGGTYPMGVQLPATPGIEGAGSIMQLGNGVPEYYQIGNKVALSSPGKYGTFAQYSVAHFSRLIKLNENITFEQGASACVNPISVYAMLEIAKEKNAKAVIQNAAASALGRMFVKYFQENGIQVINVVRREEQVELLKKEGAQIILNQTNPEFINSLTKLANSLNATVLFDPVADHCTGDYLSCMPNGSTAYVYGGLARKRVSNISISDLIFKQKTIKGFWMTSWLKDNDNLQNVDFQNKINQLLQTSLATNYSKEVTLEQFNEALLHYQQNSTEGKVLIKPN